MKEYEKYLHRKYRLSTEEIMKLCGIDGMKEEIINIHLGDFMYRKYHWEQNEQCDGGECTSLTAYVRIEGKWVKIGSYGSECKKFEALDLQQEEQERLAKQRRDNIKLEMRRIKQENRDKLKIIKSEFNVYKSFFKQQTSEHPNQKDTV